MMLLSHSNSVSCSRASVVLSGRTIARTYSQDCYRIPPSKSWNEKKQWWEEQRRQSRETNELAENSGFANPWHYKRPQIITPLPEPWFAQYQEWRTRWEAPIIAQYPPITLLDQDLEEMKQKREEDEKIKKVCLEQLHLTVTQDTAKKLANETEEEKKEREVREEREKRLAQIRASHEQAVVAKKRSRETEADRKGDTKSLSRALDKRLFLIVKKNRKEFAWQFPQGLIEEGETIRGAAEREFEEECNVQKKLQTHFTGRGPCHYISYAYPPELQKKYNTYGCKGQVSLNPTELVDYRWVTKDELKDYLDPKLLAEVMEVLPNDGKHEHLERPNYHNMDKKEKE